MFSKAGCVLIMSLRYLIRCVDKTEYSITIAREVYLRPVATDAIVVVPVLFVFALLEVVYGVA